MVEAASPKLSVLRARVLAAQEKIATQGVTLRQAIEELAAAGQQQQGQHRPQP